MDYFTADSNLTTRGFQQSKFSRGFKILKGGTETSRSSQKWDLLPLIYGILTQILDMLVMADLAIDFIFTILA